MINLLLKISIIYQFLIATALLFYGFIQFNEHDKAWPLIAVITMGWPLCVAQVIVFCHVIKAMPFVNQAILDLKNNRVRQTYSPAEGKPLHRSDERKSD